MTKKRFLPLIPLLFTIAAFLSGQRDDIIPFTDARWTFDGASHEIVEYRGKTSLHFTGRSGFARLDDANFLNGSIEFDVALPDKRTFLGFMFRMRDPDHYEEFYFRPHQSGNPDSYQYSPVFNGLNGWQIYTGPGFSQAVDYHFDDWTHVKITVNGSRAEVFLNGVSHPEINLPFLLHKPAAGGVGVWGRDGYFTNFRYTREEDPPLQSPARDFPKIPAGTVTEWSVSPVFPEDEVAGKTKLPESLVKAEGWQKLAVDPFGNGNLAMVAKRGEVDNTVLARLFIEAEAAGPRELQLAFSDRARVFLNGEALYYGHDEFRSRDYRFLGTVGYFDSVFLPLKKGRNELVVAVSENFGGWVIRGFFPDQSGVRASLK